MSTVFTDARQTLAPHDEVKHGPLPPLLVGMTLVTGLVDAFSYLVLGHVFVANMTGGDRGGDTTAFEDGSSVGPCELTDELTELYRRLSMKGEQNHDSTRTIQTSHRLHRHGPYGEPHGIPADPGRLSADRL